MPPPGEGAKSVRPKKHVASRARAHFARLRYAFLMLASSAPRSRPNTLYRSLPADASTRRNDSSDSRWKPLSRIARRSKGNNEGVAQVRACVRVCSRRPKKCKLLQCDCCDGTQSHFFDFPLYPLYVRHIEPCCCVAAGATARPDAPACGSDGRRAASRKERPRRPRPLGSGPRHRQRCVQRGAAGWVSPWHASQHHSPSSELRAAQAPSPPSTRRPTAATAAPRR